MKFLSLCRRLALESGTISGVQPSTVLNQTDRLGKIVGWINEAWFLIQQAQPNGWPWMRKEFSGKVTTIGNGRYTGATWALANFGRFVDQAEYTSTEMNYAPYTIYLQSDGAAAEAPLRNITWAEYKIKYTRGTQTNDKPSEYAISPTGEFCLGPIPDDVYVISGEFVETEQVLLVDADIPNMPGHSTAVDTAITAGIRAGDAHMIIVWRAMVILAEYDEAAVQMAAAWKHYNEAYQAMVAKRLPRITVKAEPIA